ncbi:MAG: aminotransferase class V-fold PLP-dependent enzyme [Salinibacter sp.]
MLSRRQVLRQLSSLPLIGGMLGGVLTDEAAEAGASHFKYLDDGYHDYFNELGLRTIINAKGTYTSLTGSLMPPEVQEAWDYAANHYVELTALQDKAGRRIAEIGHSEAAMVTAGAASALTLGTAATITGTDEKKIRKLPNLPGPRPEVIIQKSHRFGYDHSVRNTGIKLVEVEGREELEGAVNENTVMMMFLNKANPDGTIQDEEFVELGKKHDVPTFNDCAADVPPVENLWEYNEMGFDLVTFSGGKGLRGPQSAGLLFGREDLIEAAKLQHVPYGNTIGRGMKVNKEEVLAMLVALERYVNLDHEAQWGRWKSQIETIQSAADSVPGVETEYYVPDIANHVPTLRITWDQDQVQISPAEVQRRLREGHPSIEVNGGSEDISLTTWMMRPEEVQFVGQRIHDLLDGAMVQS